MLCGYYESFSLLQNCLIQQIQKQKNDKEIKKNTKRKKTNLE